MDPESSYYPIDYPKIRLDYRKIFERNLTVEPCLKGVTDYENECTHPNFWSIAVLFAMEQNFGNLGKKIELYRRFILLDFFWVFLKVRKKNYTGTLGFEPRSFV